MLARHSGSEEACSAENINFIDELNKTHLKPLGDHILWQTIISSTVVAGIMRIP